MRKRSANVATATIMFYLCESVVQRSGSNNNVLSVRKRSAT
ncbi:hypothetical protein [Lysinibacillus sp. G4S2]|nr:hypothetical protein [Lysinibacillus sp. G4S2]MDM5249839.1 hypothetical protein [Lysinibacillus sp. G4S2]